MKRPQLTITLSMLAVFLSGGLVGALGYRLYTVSSVYSGGAPPRRSPAEHRQRYLNELKTRLELNDSQTTKLDGILEQTRTRFREFNDKHKDEIRSIHGEQVRDIKAMLEPHQQGRYEAFLKERENRRRQYESGGR
ncbi:MAG TPA: hypothetical protein VES20_20980 [Bryobacteraceae bacterium]|nr:hypothetical protein [Bryobacteraceae bacterium]